MIIYELMNTDQIATPAMRQWWRRRWWWWWWWWWWWRGYSGGGGGNNNRWIESECRWMQVCQLMNCTGEIMTMIAASITIAPRLPACPSSSSSPPIGRIVSSSHCLGFIYRLPVVAVAINLVTNTATDTATATGPTERRCIIDAKPATTTAAGTAVMEDAYACNSSNNQPTN